MSIHTAIYGATTYQLVIDQMNRIQDAHVIAYLKHQQQHLAYFQHLFI